MKNPKGLTFIELLVVIAIFLLVMGGTVLTLSTFLTGNQLDTSTSRLTQTLKKSQANSMLRFKDSQWGVSLDNVKQRFTFFKGSSYASRDPNFDELYELPTSLSFSNVNLNGGGTEIVFNKVNGETSNYGSLEIKENYGTRQHTISINAAGQIEVD